MYLHQKVIEKYDGAEAVIDVLNQLTRKNIYAFRGFNKQDELLPSIIRGVTQFEKDESDLLKKFERYGSHYFHANTPIEFMSCAQHFGLPTRLLDFTRNPFIALSFALYSGKSNAKYSHPEDREYYYICYSSLEDNLVTPTISLSNNLYHSGYTRTDSLAVKSLQCIESMTDLFGKNKLHRNAVEINGFNGTITDMRQQQEKIMKRVILFVEPNQSNQRIIMQQGLFMFPYTLDKDQHLEILKRNSSLIKIHRDLRDDLTEYLDTLGFNAYRLMPDLSNVCAAIKREVIDGRNHKSPKLSKELLNV